MEEDELSLDFGKKKKKSTRIKEVVLEVSCCSLLNAEGGALSCHRAARLLRAPAICCVAGCSALLHVTH